MIITSETLRDLDELLQRAATDLEDAANRVGIEGYFTVAKDYLYTAKACREAPIGSAARTAWQHEENQRASAALRMIQAALDGK